MEEEESLQSRALVSQFTNTVKNKINNFLSNCVVSTSIVIGSIFFACDELLRVEKLPVCSSADLI